MSRPVRVILTFDSAAYITYLQRWRATVEAHPPRPGEDPIAWLRRLADAASWEPDGWTDDPNDTP